MIGYPATINKILIRKSKDLLGNMGLGIDTDSRKNRFDEPLWRCECLQELYVLQSFTLSKSSFNNITAFIIFS